MCNPFGFLIPSLPDDSGILELLYSILSLVFGSILKSLLKLLEVFDSLFPPFSKAN